MKAAYKGFIEIKGDYLAIYKEKLFAYANKIEMFGWGNGDVDNR